MNQNSISLPGVTAELMTDKHGPAVFIRNHGDDEVVALHPMQLRYLAERFAGLEPQPKPQLMPDPSAVLVRRLWVLADHIEDLHTALLSSRASHYTDMSHELASAGALHSIAQAYTSDLPDEAAAEPAQRALVSDETTTPADSAPRSFCTPTQAEGGERTGKASAAPAPAGQLGLDV